MAFQFSDFQPEYPLSGNESDFTITATAPTDIWRKPPAIDVFNAPIVYKEIAISSFQNAKVTVTAKWWTLYDQGGLLLVMPSRNGEKRPWLKCGIEFFHKKPFMSVVRANSSADWSLSPIPSGTVTIEMERGTGDDKDVLWVYVVGQDGEKMPVREVTSMFLDSDDAEDKKCWVGCFAAKPTESKEIDAKNLKVHFTGFEIVTRN
jgi:regulation of enolase protein 1 (concanavalin A-like superfamily)